ncbi:hypothetical protein KIN20_008289 [Parelaphostrongylus tenuis]|uniref:Uncharacterized protein n=1 Tax=Parelaphostrongylus tenuis TaxID=148309 RepID=A0AAD5MQA2_PARTN|nr:hypothetical protein KIN20_008289 [Parelaphostrongylus tenuis]
MAIRSTVSRSFEGFKKGDFDLEDGSRSDRPPLLDESDLEAIMDAQRSSSTRDLAEELGITQWIVVNKLH